MEKSDKLYRFRSKSQHILVISYLGRKMKVKFSAPYNGVSRYNTRDEVVAKQIRKSQAFRGGMIVEDDAVQCQAKKTVILAEPKKAPEPKNTPAWMRQSVKVGGRKAADYPLPTKTSKEEKKADMAAGMASAEDAVGLPDEGAGKANPKVVQDEMFQMSLEDVETYMDAKQYVNDVLHADLTRKEEVKAYCMEHNVVFPNFSFD